MYFSLLFQTVLIIDGQGGFMQRFPSCPNGTGLHSSSSIPASIHGRGLPIDPGLIFRSGVLTIIIEPVSVCHHVSWKVLPNTFSPHTTASGLSGSPTDAK